MPMKKGKILIVDDNEDVLFSLNLLLKDEMEQAVNLAVPMQVEAKTGKTWYESK